MNKPGILFKLKEWLTIPEAAAYLTKSFNEDVAEADILRLGLDGHLKLSVYFANHSYAKYGKIVPFNDTYHAEQKHRGKGFEIPFEKAFHNFNRNIPSTFKLSEYRTWKDEQYLHLEDEVKDIKGVWDLPMVGGEALDLEHQYQQLTGGPEITLIVIDGAFVESIDKQTVCQLQESFDQNEFTSGSKAQLESIERHIAENNLNEKDAENLLTRYHENREKYLEKRSTEKRVNDFYPAGGLPEDSVLVVRTQALMDLQNKVGEKNNEAQNELNPRAETAYLNAIGALLSCLTGDFKDNVFSSEAELRAFIDEKYDGYYGLSARTLAEKFSLAKKSLADEL